ncbi:hypothetical protein OH807_02155 [Kitasatospora sp. NBC_01560]|uniref:hypothetical protein n=1 Tax=Kitasatospora sp. NBC_01560 TaxID=2975965 RepID=UPI0038682C5E
MIRNTLVVLWFVLVIGGGGLVALDVRGSAGSVLRLMERWAFGGVGAATPRTIRLIAAGFVGLAVAGLGVIALDHAQHP